MYTTIEWLSKAAAVFVFYVIFKVCDAFVPVLWYIVRRTIVVRWLGGKRLLNYGEWAVITGGTDGIGKAIAIELAKNDMNIFLIARNSERLKDTEKEILSIKGYTGKVATMVVDFASQPVDYKIIQQRLNELNIGILVNNVGVSYPSAQYFTELKDEFIDEVISVNINSTMHMTLHVATGMVARKRGAIVCVGSGASELHSEPLYAAYAGAKGAVECFCRSLQAELYSSNILVQCHIPLLVSTKMSKVRKPSSTVPTAQSYAKSAVDAIKLPLGKCESPTISPHIMHQILMTCLVLLPRNVWNSVRLQMTEELRRRYMAKQQ